MSSLFEAPPVSGGAPVLRALSLGVGIQSTTVLLMALEGELEGLDVAITGPSGRGSGGIVLDKCRFSASVIGPRYTNATVGGSPRWVLVPDVVANKTETLGQWRGWAGRLRRWYGWPLAFAVQDGMTAADVPDDADVVFIGGSTRWKRRMIGHFCARFSRVHVGRVNTERWLWCCAEHEAESCDGTGWFMGDPEQLAGLKRWLAAWASGQRRRSHGPLFEGAA